MSGFKKGLGFVTSNICTAVDIAATFFSTLEIGHKAVNQPTMFNENKVDKAIMPTPEPQHEIKK
ncbi:MAG: hypothetical protein A2V86_09030 [Deltaproteobacteria bacterium RBG_16_49_23]|nr:MAG: hypothetical protein A2V86_09030 [Deltaproteobacteria bacterium RBG_16_49_23]